MYIYRFINNKNEIIYIGKTKSIKERLNNHNHLSKDCYNEISYIEYSKLFNSDELGIYERYLINKHSPKYNKEFDNNSEFRFELPKLEWKKYDGTIKIKNSNKKNNTKTNYILNDKKLRDFELCFDNVYILKDSYRFILGILKTNIFNFIEISNESENISHGDYDENFKLKYYMDNIGDIVKVKFLYNNKDIKIYLNKIEPVYIYLSNDSGELIIGRPQHERINLSFNRDDMYLLLEFLHKYKYKEIFKLRDVLIDGDKLFYDRNSYIYDYIKHAFKRINELRNDNHIAIVNELFT